MNPYSTWPRAAHVAVVLFIVIATGFILKSAQAILVPLALAILVAFLLHPMVKRIQRAGANRVLAVLLVVSVATVFAGTIAFVVSVQVKALADDLPNHHDNIQHRVLVLKRYLRGGTFERLQSMITRINATTEQVVDREVHDHLPQESTQPSSETSDAAQAQAVSRGVPAAEQPVKTAADADVIEVRPAKEQSIQAKPIVFSALELLGNGGIVLLLVIFFLIQQADIRDRIVSAAGRGALATTTKALEEAGARISRYVLMQFVVNITFGTCVTIGLIAIGVPYAVMWGLCAALFRYVPYVGPWAAALLPFVASLVVSTGWAKPLLVVALFVTLEAISSNIMEPILYGHSVGLSEVGIILAAIAWAWIWGAIGLVLATPLTVCLVVLGKYVPGLRTFDHLFGQRPPVGPPLRLYQRLLAKDDEDAEDLVREYLAEHSLLETCDQLLLPTVEFVHQDLRGSRIDADDADWILRSLELHLTELATWKQSAHHAASGPADAEYDQRPVILGIPAHADDEELVLQVLRQGLTDVPCRMEIVSNDRLVSERLAEIAERTPLAVCVSALPPGDLAFSRQLCKRIRQQFPDIRLYVGRWAPQAKPERNDQLKEAGADDVVSSISAMHGVLSSVVQLSRASRSPGEGSGRRPGRPSPAAIGHG